MANFKRRHRRRAGIKGCCGMCMLQTTDGIRNHRKLTLGELADIHTEREQITEYFTPGAAQGIMHRIRKYSK